MYYLFGFSNGHVNVYTRGKDIDQAMDHASKSEVFQRGTTIYSLDFIPLAVKDMYSKNHPYDWLHTPMRWLSESKSNIS